MFLNYSNHPSAAWSAAQLQAARQYDEPILDVPFPAIPADMTAQDVALFAEKEAAKLLRMKPSAVLCQGEMTLTFHVVQSLRQAGVPVLAACSERRVKETVTPDGISSKQSVFLFVQFREYC